MMKYFKTLLTVVLMCSFSAKVATAYTSKDDPFAVFARFCQGVTHDNPYARTDIIELNAAELRQLSQFLPLSLTDQHRAWMSQDGDWALVLIKDEGAWCEAHAWFQSSANIKRTYQTWHDQLPSTFKETQPDFLNEAIGQTGKRIYTNLLAFPNSDDSYSQFTIVVRPSSDQLVISITGTVFDDPTPVLESLFGRID